MSLDVREINGVLIVQPNRARIAASIDTEDLHEALADAIKDGRLAVAVDLSGVEYADHATIDMLIDVHKALAQNKGSLCLFNAPDAMREFFHQTILNRFIRICSDQDDAIRSFAGRPKRKRRSFWRRLF